MFVGLHVMLAHATGYDALAITDDEGKSFMGAAQNVLRHYSVETTQKTLDWIAFGGVAAGIYAPRIAAIMVERGKRGGPAPVLKLHRGGKANGAPAPEPHDIFGMGGADVHGGEPYDGDGAA